MVLIRQMVHKGWLFLLAIVLLLFIPILVRAEVPSPQELFQKLLESSRTVDFKGKFRFTSLGPDRNLAFEAIVIRKTPGKLRMQVISPSEMRDMGMVMDGKKRWRIPGGRDRGRRPLPPLSPDSMGDSLIRNAQILLRSYDIQVLMAEPVANRNTYMAVIAPRLPGRPSRKVWIDAEMGVILKMESYDSQNRLRWLFAYSDIDFGSDIKDEVFQPRPGMEEDRGPRQERGRGELWKHDQGKLDLSKIRKEIELDVIVPEKPPAGFILQSIQAVRFGRSRNAHLMYTDGLSVLSVFQSLSNQRGPAGRRGPRREDGPPRREDGPPRRDVEAEKVSVQGTEVQIISRGPMSIFRWSQGKIYLTLIGELEKGEMTKIVESFVGTE